MIYPKLIDLLEKLEFRYNAYWKYICFIHFTIKHSTVGRSDWKNNLLFIYFWSYKIYYPFHGSVIIAQGIVLMLRILVLSSCVIPAPNINEEVESKGSIRFGRCSRHIYTAGTDMSENIKTRVESRKTTEKYKTISNIESAVK